jgi:AraC-like DNA-binding protein
MGLVLDTSLVHPDGRVDAVNDALSVTEAPMRFAGNSAGKVVRLRMHAWPLGAGAHVIAATGTGSRLLRGPEHLRVSAPERVGVAIQMGTPGYLSAGGASIVTPPGHLHVADETQAFDLRWDGEGGSKAFVVDYDRLGVPVDVVRKAALRIRHSPLYDLFRAHLAELFKSGEELPSSAQAMLGNATTELFRALVTTAADGHPASPGLLDVQYLRITRYVEDHLTDQGLDAEQVAAAHHISVRQVYAVWSANDVPLSQWIIAARLEGARRDLARPSPRHGTVAAVAHRWGFRDSTHFSRRFRAAYGMSPRDWIGLQAAT